LNTPQSTPSDQTESCHALLLARLAHQFDDQGCWPGRLSSSALSTAVAAVAIAELRPEAERERIRSALSWLVQTVNHDGGWGDTPDSPSNPSTTLLVWAALAKADEFQVDATEVARGAEQWLTCISADQRPAEFSQAILQRYGRDQTFSAPILTMCALTGRLGPEPDVWELVPQLPFELAALPFSIFRWLRLPVVSYAIPALIAIGLVHHRRGPESGSPRARLRTRLTPRCMRILETMQPEGGGFLEATPLTAFVTLSLAAAGFRDHTVTRQGLAFLLKSARADGSWPIDTNLTTWVTTLAVNALQAGPPQVAEALLAPHRDAIQAWLLGQQVQTVHPFTHSPPGGWAWTDLPGGVPDADDTAGALLALRSLGPSDPATRQATEKGLHWLLRLQNRDGGIPTFCRGWGALPFDRSCPDLTAHAVMALEAWLADTAQTAPSLARRMERALRRSLDYLEHAQTDEGTWLPLWFGSQAAPGQTNPTYGTARVLSALQSPQRHPNPRTDAMARKATQWLLTAQNSDGGWGGAPGVPSTLEETGLSVFALLGDRHPPETQDAVTRGIAWLVSRILGEDNCTPAPIGLYFAKLWYAEDLYPLIFATAALGRYLVTQDTAQGAQ
jgi:squalene-hopene/tetraprenyl-beta-curcumene cyclase